MYFPLAGEATPGRGPAWWPDPSGGCLDFLGPGVDQSGDQLKPSWQGYVRDGDVRLWEVFDLHSDLCVGRDFKAVEVLAGGQQSAGGGGGGVHGCWVRW